MVLVRDLKIFAGPVWSKVPNCSGPVRYFIFWPWSGPGFLIFPIRSDSFWSVKLLFYFEPVKTSDIISSDVDLILQKFNNVPDLFVKLPTGYLAMKLVTCLLSRLPGKVIVFGLSKEICTRIIIEHSDHARIIQPGKLVRHGFLIHTPYCPLMAIAYKF